MQTESAVRTVKKPFSWDSRCFVKAWDHDPASPFRAALAAAIQLSLYHQREVVILRHWAGGFDAGFEPVTLLRLPRSADIFARVNGWELKYE
jgi:hypothetical protein